MCRNPNITRIQFAAALTTLCALVGGCGKPAVEENGPSYAELVVTYNAELAMLDRLEKKKEELIRKHQSGLRPASADSLRALEGLLGSASELNTPLDPNDITGVEGLLDRVADRMQTAHDVAGQLADAVASESGEKTKTPEEVQRNKELTGQFNKELTAIDKEIVAQKARVERAREARDAAEAKRQ